MKKEGMKIGREGNSERARVIFIVPIFRLGLGLPRVTIFEIVRAKPFFFLNCFTVLN